MACFHDGPSSAPQKCHSVGSLPYLMSQPNQTRVKEKCDPDFNVELWTSGFDLSSNPNQASAFMFF